MKSVSAIVIGGGHGTRLFPLTLERAKPAVGFAGKYRLIDITISNCINAGINRIFVLTQFMSASLHRHIMQTYKFDAFADGFVDILAAEQTPQKSEWFQGTADAVRATLKHTTYYQSQNLLILSGDHLYRMDYSDLIRFHRLNNAEITIGVSPVPLTDAHRMGLLRVNADGEVEAFVEKPQDPKTARAFLAPDKLFKSNNVSVGTDKYLGSMGIYVFNPDVLEKVLKNQKQTDFGKEIIPSAIGKFRVMAYPFLGHWRDIGTIKSFFDANIDLARKDADFTLYAPNWPFYSRPRALPPSRVVESQIQDSLLVEGCNIQGANIQNSVVGMRSLVNEGTFLNQVVMLGADFYDGEELISGIRKATRKIPPLGIGKNCRIERAIIDKNARIGDNVEINPTSPTQLVKEKTYWVKDGVTIITKGAVIPSGTKI